MESPVNHKNQHVCVCVCGVHVCECVTYCSLCGGDGGSSVSSRMSMNADGVLCVWVRSLKQCLEVEPLNLILFLTI